MSLGRPDLLVYLWLLPLAAALLWAGGRRRRRRLAAMAGQGRQNAGVLGVRLSGARAGAKALMLLLALGLTLFALARPRWDFTWKDVKHHGVDIVLAVDVSRSMLAQDVSPSRLERAKREIIDLLDHQQGDRIGLVAFAGDAFVQCPLTEDMGAVRMFLSYLDTDLIPVQGTDLGGAIDESVKALFDGSPEGSEGRAIILITDGEDQEGNAQRAAAAAKAKGVRVYTIGVGSKAGGPIPEPGGGFKKDAAGNLVLTKPDEAALEKIALATGGMFVRSTNGTMELTRIYDEGIRKQIKAREFDATREKLWNERFQVFLGLALAFLIGEHFLADVLPVAGALALALALTASGKAEANTASEAQAAFVKGDYSEAARQFATADDPTSIYNGAVSQYRAGNLAAAAQGFAQAATTRDAGLAERSLYNLGNAEAGLGKLDEAASAYQRALALDGSDKEAKDNLEYVKKLKEQQKKQNQKQDQKQQDQKQDQKQQDQKQQDQKQQDQKQQDQKQQDQKQQDQKQQDQKQQDQKQQDQKQQDQKQQDQKQQDQKQQQSAQQEQDKNQDGKKPEASRPNQEQQQQPTAAEKEGSEAGQKPQNQPQAMSREQAERVLRAVEDNAGKYLVSPSSRTSPPRRPEKDW